MDVLALILACSLHPDDAFVRVMVDIQSSGNAYFVGDLATLKTTDNLTSADDALRVAEDIARHGGRPAVGLLGVPLDWAARFGRSPRDLFDACTNLAIGSAVYSEYQATCSPARPSNGHVSVRHRRRLAAVRHRLALAAERACILTHLARDLGLHGAPAEVLKLTVAAEAEHHDEAPAENSSIFGDGADDAAAKPLSPSDTRVFVDAGPISGAVEGNAPPTTPALFPPRSPSSSANLPKRLSSLPAARPQPPSDAR